MFHAPLLALLALQAPAWQKLPLSHDWYGVYLQGKKVGAVESIREKRQSTVLHTSQKLVAHVAGMGQNVSVEVLTEQDFDWQTGAVLGIKFKQTSPTGAVEITGNPVGTGKKLKITITAGGESRALGEVDPGTIKDYEAGELLAIDPKAKVGARVSTTKYDPAIQKMSSVDYTLARVETRVLDGVETPVRHITSKIRELNIEEESAYAADGRVLESKTANLFTLRLEDEARAKDIGYSQDVLVAFVVPVDRPIDDPNRVNDLRVSFTGSAGFVMPVSDRQEVKGKGDAVEVHVTRTPFDERKAVSLPLDAAKFKDTLKPEALYQSDAPEVRALAKEILGSEKNSFKAAKALLEWVYRRVEKAYVPAVSNALEVLHSRKGDCGEHAALFIALARAAGIPARPVVGITYWPPGNGFGYHAWAEIYVGQWIAVDPTQGTMSADATHIQLAGGDLAEQSKITLLIGKLKARVEKVM